jgi:hypothetical protein
MDTPLLTKLSRYKSTPKWTLASPCERDPQLSSVGSPLGPAAYNPTACIDRTSKFRKISPACSFGSAERFRNSKIGMARHPIPGPGQYSPPADYSRAPFRSYSNITFGLGQRLFAKNSSSLTPGPGEYDIRQKHRRCGSTFDTRGIHVNHRHGWYYDVDIRARRDSPAPGTYDPTFPHDKTDRKFSFGNGDRPPVHNKWAVNLPSPGRYPIKSSLAGRSFSFTHATGKAKAVPPELTVGPLCGQPTQFG